MRILGIDPGLKNFGYAVIEYTPELHLVCAGEILTQKDEKKRLQIVYDSIDDVIKTYKPNFCVLEKTFVNNNAATSLALGQARGVILLCLQKNDLEYQEISATSIKKIISGDGKAQKKEIQEFVRGLFSIELGHNAADAVIISLCANINKI